MSLPAVQDIPELQNMVLPDYDQKFCLELAYGMEEPRSICERYGISEAEFEILQNSPQFRGTVNKFVAELAKSGSTFRTKASVLAEDLLKMTHALACDTTTPPVVRLECVKFLAKVGGHDDSAKKELGANGPNFQININLPSPT